MSARDHLRKEQFRRHNEAALNVTAGLHPNGKPLRSSRYSERYAIENGFTSQADMRGEDYGSD